MRRKLKGFGVGLALATMLTTVANATLTVYEWVPHTSTSDNGSNSSGTFGLDSSLSLSGTVTIDPSGPSTFSFTLGNVTFNIFNGSISLLLDGNLQLDGNATSTSSQNLAVWAPKDSSGPEENVVSLAGDPDFGDWVPVPEPTTMIAGALLLLPFGAGILRILRKSRAA